MSIDQLVSHLAELTSDDLYDLVVTIKNNHPVLYNMLVADLEYV